MCSYLRRNTLLVQWKPIINANLPAFQWLPVEILEIITFNHHKKIIEKITGTKSSCGKCSQCWQRHLVVPLSCLILVFLKENFKAALGRHWDWKCCRCSESLCAQPEVPWALRATRWPCPSPGMVWKLQSLVQGRSCEMLPPADTQKVRPGTFFSCASLRKCFVWLSLKITVPGDACCCGYFSSLASSHKTVLEKGCVCAGLHGSLLGNAQEVRQKMRKYQSVCFTLSLLRTIYHNVIEA